MSLQELEVLRGVVESNMPSTEGIDSFFESLHDYSSRCRVNNKSVTQNKRSPIIDRV